MFPLTGGSHGRNVHAMSVAIVLKSFLGGVISKYPPIPPWRLASPERGFWLATFSGLQGNFRHTAKRVSASAEGRG